MAIILLTQVDGTENSAIIVTNDTIYVNEVAILIADVTDVGPIRTSPEGIIVEYPVGGQVSAVQVGAAHSILWSVAPPGPPTAFVEEGVDTKLLDEISHKKPNAEEDENDEDGKHPHKGKRASKK